MNARIGEAAHGGNLRRAGIAGGWIIGGRLLGLGWTAALVAILGIGQYGTYAIAFALAATVAAPLDNPFGVRSLRVSTDRFLSERSARAILGMLLVIAGALLYAEVFLVGFALIVAGGEIAFNAVKSAALRDGYPNVVQRMDVVRQFASIVLGLGCLVLIHGSGLALACAFYLAPYLVVIVIAAARTIRARPVLPAPPREVAILFVDALALAGYIQGDVLLLGALAGPIVAGVYSLASLVALAAASLAQMYAQTFHERLRAASGHHSAGPATRTTALLGIVLGAGVAAVGGIVLASGLNSALGLTLLVMSVFTALRSATMVAQTILYVRGGDTRRVAGAVVVTIIKLILIAVLFRLGAVGAALACVAAELLLVAWFTRLAYHDQRSPVLGGIATTSEALS